jgi:transposase
MQDIFVLGALVDEKTAKKFEGSINAANFCARVANFFPPRTKRSIKHLIWQKISESGI